MHFLSRQLRSDLIIVFSYRGDIHAQLPRDVTLIAHTGVLPQVDGELLFLGADTVWIFCDGTRAQGGDLRLHLQDQLRQFLLTFLPGVGVDIPGVLFPIRPHRGVSAFPKIFLDLLEVARPRSAPLRLIWYERFPFSGFLLPVLGQLRLGDALVDADRCILLHLIGDVGVDVQSGPGGDVPNDGGQCFDVHAVFQGDGGKGVPQIMKSDSFAPGALQNDLEPFSYIARIDGLLRLDPGWEHQVREDAFPVRQQEFHHSGRQDDGPEGSLGLGLADDQLSTHRVDLLVDPQFPCLFIQVLPSESQDSPRRRHVVSSSRNSSYIPSSLAWSRNRWISSPERIFISFCSGGGSLLYCPRLYGQHKKPPGRKR